MSGFGPQSREACRSHSAPDRLIEKIRLWLGKSYQQGPLRLYLRRENEQSCPNLFHYRPSPAGEYGMSEKLRSLTLEGERRVLFLEPASKDYREATAEEMDREVRALVARG
jgi:hypothetical protein